MPKISVIVPVYNTASYLAECLNSIINQTLKDIEIICVNDGSTDDSPLVLESYKNKDERIVVINKKNGGLSSARNTGIKHARGEYVYFIDSDDYLELDAFERLNNSLLEDKPQVVCFGLKAFLDPSFIDSTFDLLGKEKYYERSYLEEKVYSGPELYELLMGKNNFVSSCCLYITERKFLLQSGISFYEGLLHEDELYTRLLFFKAERIKILKNKFYKRRYRNDSITTVQYTEKNAIAYLIIAESMFELNTQIRSETLNRDVSIFFNLSINLIEKLASQKNTKTTATIKRLYKSHLKKQFPKYNKRLFILRFQFLKPLIAWWEKKKIRKKR